MRAGWVQGKEIRLQRDAQATLRAGARTHRQMDMSKSRRPVTVAHEKPGRGRHTSTAWSAGRGQRGTRA